MFKILFVRLPMSPKVDINVYRTNLLHCAFCVPYPSLISTLRAYAPYPSLISALGGLRAFTLINKRLTRLCIVLLQIPLCLSAPCKKVSYSNERIWTYSKMQFFRWKPPFGQVWPKNQFVSLSWNLVSWPIRICRIQWWCSLLFLTRNTLFG